jgi:hypothetical protein
VTHRSRARGRSLKILALTVAAIAPLLLSACAGPRVPTGPSGETSTVADGSVKSADPVYSGGGAVPTSSTGQVMLGLYSQLAGLSATASIEFREKTLGRTMRIHHSFYNWNDPFPDASQNADASAGRIPLITWWGLPYADVTSGSQDELIHSRAQVIRAFGHPIMLAWAPEMNLDFTPWSGPQNGNDPAAFVRAWRHIHDVFAAEHVTNVSWVWTPNSESKPGGFDTSSPNNWRHYYPGDAYVDWVGIDGYNWGRFGNNAWRSLARFVGPIYRDYASRKPIAIVETASNESGGDKGAWIAEARAWIAAHPAIRALVWFDQRSAAQRDWRIDSSPGALSAFRALAADWAFAG